VSLRYLPPRVSKTPAGAQLTEAHRQVQLHVNMATVRDLLQLWGTVDPKNLRHTIAPFTRAASTLILNGRRHSSTASASYYLAFRQAEGVKGTVVVEPPAGPASELVSGLVRGAGLAGIMNGYRRGLSPDEAHANGFVKLAGSATQLVLGGGRATLLDAIRSDPAAHGFQRVTDGTPCAFCAMIASQGIIAKDASNAGFEAHGHCGCSAEPAYEGSPVNAANERFRAAWDETTSGLSSTDALNAFRRSMSSPE
jgi:hypothetical protein